MPALVECIKNSSRNEVQNNKYLYEETRKIPNKQFTKEIIKIRPEISDIKKRKAIEKITKLRVVYLKKDKLNCQNLSQTNQGERERTQMNNIINEKGDIKTYTIEIQRIINSYYEQLYANKLDNLEKMEKKSQKHRTCQD